MNIRPIDNDDLLLWPCGTWCYRYELPEMSHKSDDYEVIPLGTARYEELLDRIERGLVPLA